MSSREEALIQRMVARVPHVGPPAGPGDDAAWSEATGEVVTTDLMVEGTHFLRPHPPAWLGHKLLACNLSDVAAMGARATRFTVTAALPADTPDAWWDALAEGLGALARERHVELVGGDVVASPGPVLLGITAWGSVSGPPLTRAGGRPRDVLMVAGHLGRAWAGGRRWLASAGAAWGAAPPAAADACLQAHLRPDPPLDVGPWALAHGATAGLDLSDGLAMDAARLARASGVALDVDLSLLPDDPACEGLTAAERAAGGEDYGLLVLVPPGQASAFEAAGLVPIGRAAASEAPNVTFREAGTKIDLGSLVFRHFPG